jgi:hypothetical protein
LLDKLFKKKKHGFIQLDKAKLDLMMINTTRRPETRNSTTRLETRNSATRPEEDKSSI